MIEAAGIRSRQDGDPESRCRHVRDRRSRPIPQAESVQIVSYEPDRVVLKVHAEADGVLVLSETYEEGWHAHVDGDKAPVDEAYGVVRAVPITAGDHTVVLTYDPWSLRYGFYLSLLGAALSLAVIGAFAVSRMRGGALEVDR